MKSHEIFETVVHVVQTAFKEHPNATVHKRYKVLNRAGRKREIDVLIMNAIDREEHTIAIECKDLKRPVSVTTVEAFKAKCERIPSVKRMIIVSRSGFQKDAINAAKEFGIELHGLERITHEHVKSWYNQKSVGYVSWQNEFIKIIPCFEDGEVRSVSGDDLLYLPNGPQGVELMDMLRCYVPMVIDSNTPLVREIPKEMVEYLSFELCCPGTLIKIGDSKLELSKILIGIKTTYVISDVAESMDVYSKSLDGSPLTETVTIVSDNNPVISLVKGDETGTYEMYLSHINRSQTGLLHYANVKVEKNK
jgi:hypothetical protein